MKKILVPCDFSPIAIEAFKFAADLARMVNGSITVLFVIDLPVFVGGFDLQPYLYDPNLANDLKDWAKKKFEALLKLDTHNIPIALEIEQSSVLYSVRKAIKKTEADLVIMGTHGAHGANEFLFGSNAEKVVRFAPVPVITVKKSLPIYSISKILFPTDLETLDSDMIDKVKELQDLFAASLDILWVNTPMNFKTDGEVEKKMARVAEDHGLSNYSVCICNDLGQEGGIAGFARKSKADLIAMATHGKRGLSHIFDGSIAEKVVNHVGLPVWTYSLQGRE
jgi:nucleotide-binding universal stress UspA family protein